MTRHSFRPKDPSSLAVFQISHSLDMVPLPVILIVTVSSYVASQSPREFPPVINLALTKPVHSTPTDASCGYPTRSTYCRSEDDPNSILTCKEEYCDQACPGRYELPVFYDLLQASNYDVCVTKDTINKAGSSTPFSAQFYSKFTKLSFSHFLAEFSSL